MPTTFRPYEPDQLLLLPPDMSEWLPRDHLACRLSDLIDAADLSAFHAPYEVDGRRNRPYEPRMMVKVWLQSYATGVFSSRATGASSRRMRPSGSWRWAIFQAIGRCASSAAAIRGLQGDVRVGRSPSLASLGKLSIDGTKVRANASKRKAMSYERMKAEERRLREEIAALMARSEDKDAEDDARFGESFRGGGRGSGRDPTARGHWLETIRAARERLEALQREADDARGRSPGQDRNPKGGRPYKRACGEPDPKAQSNFTDPDSAIMKTSAEGFQQCYNAQVVVDGDNQLIMATELTANASDQGSLPGLLDGARRPSTRRRSERVLADAGYCNEKDLADLETRGIDGYVAPGREGRKMAVRNREDCPATARMVDKLSTPEDREHARSASTCPRRRTDGSRN